MPDLITFPEIAALLTEELGEPVGERRIFNAIRAKQLAILRVKPGRGSVGGNPQRAIMVSQIDIVRKHIEGTRPVPKEDATWIISSLLRAGWTMTLIADHCGKDESTVSKWYSNDRRMRYVYFEMLDKLLESLS